MSMRIKLETEIQIVQKKTENNDSTAKKSFKSLRFDLSADKNQHQKSTISTTTANKSFQILPYSANAGNCLSTSSQQKTQKDQFENLKAKNQIYLLSRNNNGKTQSSTIDNTIIGKRRISLNQKFQKQQDDHFISLFTYNKTASGLKSEYKNIKNGPDDVAAYYKPRRNLNKYDEKQDKLMNAISYKSSDNSVQMQKFYNEKKVNNKDKYQIIFKNGQVQNLDELNFISDAEVRALYKAKCEDLVIPEVEDQYEKFKENCQLNSVNGKLKLHNFNLGPRAAKVIADIMVFLQIFRYIDNFIGNEGLMAIADALQKQSHIIRIDVSTNNITQLGTDYLYSSLIRNNTLIDIDISSKEGRFRNRMTAKGVEALSQVILNNPFLQILNLSGNALKNEGIRALCQAIQESQYKAIISLDIAENEISYLACEYLHNLLVDSNILRLNLKGNNIGNQGAEKLSQAFYFSRSKLIYINMASCGLKQLGMIKILDAIKYNYQVQTLILDDNFGGKGHSFNIMQSLMSQNRCLVQFSAQNCMLDDSFCIPLGDGLHNNTRLKSLNISHNQIGNEGAISIATALSFKGNNTNNTTNCLQELIISHNDIGEAGGIELSKMIQSNKAILRFNLSYNKMGDQTGQDMIRAIGDNDKIEYLDLNKNQINCRYVEFIEEKCKRNIAENQKAIVPHFQKDLKNLQEVTSKYPQVQRRMARADKSNVKENLKYQQEQLRFEKYKTDLQYQSQIIGSELINIERLSQKLSLKLEELDKQCKLLLVRENKEKTRIKANYLRGELHAYRRIQIDINSQNEVLESKILQMKAERLYLLKEQHKAMVIDPSFNESRLSKELESIKKENSIKNDKRFSLAQSLSPRKRQDPLLLSQKNDSIKKQTIAGSRNLNSLSRQKQQSANNANLAKQSLMNVTAFDNQPIKRPNSKKSSYSSAQITKNAKFNTLKRKQTIISNNIDNLQGISQPRASSNQSNKRRHMSQKDVQVHHINLIKVQQINEIQEQSSLFSSDFEENEKNL
ncbi:UNKNOWN [Stylonychia lemnae]|uniref:Leucine Rich Repeat family protein n=1 Tax=Stylonychia lemnae TaxID=5949 RepID=A0A078AJ14_STYLE|nr:UNKNOWN [Stylonychia lemnae]|eukprot:CDW80798.1 UNKNOWN [Stylonychia lemnae]